MGKKAKAEQKKDKQDKKKKKKGSTPATAASAIRPATDYFEASQPAISRRAGPTISPQQRHEMIATAAYYIASRRGFAPGDPSADWLAAEAEIDRLLNDLHANAALHKKSAL